MSRLSGGTPSDMISGQSTLPVWTPQHLRLATDAAGVALWSWNVDTDRLTMDERAYDLWGIPVTTDVCFEDLSSHIHPADRDRVRAAFAATRGVSGAYEIDFRICVDEEVRWVSARGKGDDEGIVGRVLYGVFLDVTQRKQAEEAHELLSGEMSHRVKNLLAIASGLTAITSRTTSTAAEMARELTQRLVALGRAHDLVRPDPRYVRKEAALLGDLLAVLLSPYDDADNVPPRVRVSVPRISVGEASASALALVVHELATNSLKYGALSSRTGTLDVSCTDKEGDGSVLIGWTERGGPRVETPSGSNGFGSRMIHRTMSSQLGGEIAFAWPPEGVVATLRLDRRRLAA